MSSKNRETEINESARAFMHASIRNQYSYNFKWMGRPIIQYPQDLIAVQEIIWDVKPDLIIETGVAHGGSAVFHASLLELNAQSGGPKSAEVWCIEIDLRTHNREALVAHSMYPRLRIIDGSSVDEKIAELVSEKAARGQRVLVILDSNHTHDHVLRELQLYAPLVSVGSYCVVFDTVIEDLEGVEFIDRPWGRGNNPKTAVLEFLSSNPNFVVDGDIDNKLLISAAPSGYLKRIK